MTGENSNLLSGYPSMAGALVHAPSRVPELVQLPVKEHIVSAEKQKHRLRLAGVMLVGWDPVRR